VNKSINNKKDLIHYFSSKIMKVALITFEFYPKLGGIARHLNSFCKAFRKINHSLYVFNGTHEGRNIYNILDKNDYKLKDLIVFLKKKQLAKSLFLSIWKIVRDRKTPLIHRIFILLYLLLKPNYLIKTIKNLNKIYPYLKKHDFNFIIGGGAGVNVLLLIFILSRVFNKKVLTWAHGNEFLVHSRWSLKTFYLRNLDKIILSNKYTEKLIKKIHYLSDNQIVLINYGLILKDYELIESKERLRKEFNISKDTFVLFSVGRHVSRKKFDLVIKAVKEIKKLDSILDLKYYLIGRGAETPNLKNLVKDLNLEEYIIFMGVCDESTRNKFYKMADIFLMPSIKEKESIEGFGIVFLEANYYGIPVIGASSGGIREAIDNGKTGLLVKPNDLEDLVEKILFLYKNREIRKKMGYYAHERVIKYYNWEFLIKDYVKLFKKLLC
jgi:glycosyltransferase involved in cell wall biosynthesis